MMQKKANIIEIGPRDGFQNLKEFIPTQIKKDIIDRLVVSGLKKIQATSFVSPKAIPQMRDAFEVAEYAIKKHPDIEFFALVPNVKGAKLAVEAGLKEITPVMSLSESHNKSNVNRTTEQSVDEIALIRSELPDTKITMDIATVFGCPFEGRMKTKTLLELIDRLVALGIGAFTLCDTIGVAYPKQIEEVFGSAKKAFPGIEFGTHIHDTRNMGILNSYIALQCGADNVQTSVGGLGGCPFAPGASGNTATEDFIYMLEHEGYDTGVNFEMILSTAAFLYSEVDGNYSGHHIKITVPWTE